MRDAPGMYSYVGFKKATPLIDDPVPNPGFMGDEGGLIATRPDFLPPHWMEHLRADPTYNLNKEA